MKKINKSTISDFIPGMALTLIVLFFFWLSWGPLETLEQNFYDLRVKLFVKPATAPIVVISIDDQSIARLGRWPWPRAYIASLINKLQEADAKVIGLDIIYSEKDLNQGLEEVRNVIHSIETASQFASGGLINELKDAEKRLNNDGTLAAAIKNSKKVVLPLYFVLGKPDGPSGMALTAYLWNNSLESSSLDSSIAASKVTAPIADFAAGSLGIGHINIAADSDGTVRSEPLFINYEKRLFPSFAMQLSLKYLNVNLKELHFGPQIQFGLKAVPVQDSNRMLISYVNAISDYSFFDVYYNKITPGAFKDKIVIIAFSAAGLGEKHVTPTAVGVPPGTIIANVVDNIISGDHISRPDWSSTLELIVIILFGLYIAIVIPIIKASRSAIISLSLLLVWIFTSVILFAGFGYWIKFIYAAFLLIIGYIIVVSKRYLLVKRTKEGFEADSVETNKILGLSFQGQGMLDTALEKFRKCPVEDDSVKELLYNLGLDFERKRMFSKAIVVYDHIAKGGGFKDVDERIDKLTAAGDTIVFAPEGAKNEVTVLMDNAGIKPTLGRYEIIKELGSGAMGKVFLGRDPKFNRDVAIKTLLYEEVAAEERVEVKKIFSLEAEAASRLSHANIVTIYDVGEDYGVAYMAMELFDGDSLTKYCHKENLLPLLEVIRIISSVSGALNYAHLNGVVHRDIKPANIIRLNNREIKVADFGIARVMAASKTQTGVVMDNPSYMSPEQIAGLKVDGRSDLFSLGVVFYELLAGQKPFEADNYATLMYNITSITPQPLHEIIPEIPDNVTVIVEKMLAKDPALRYQTGSDVTDALVDCWN